MSITSIATDTVKHYNDIRVHIFSLFYQKEFNSLSKNNPYLIYVIGCLLVFNNLISSGKDNMLTLQQLIKIHSNIFTQECNSLSKYIVIDYFKCYSLFKNNPYLINIG